MSRHLRSPRLRRWHRGCNATVTALAHRAVEHREPWRVWGRPSVDEPQPTPSADKSTVITS